jgi:hypothetical protein
MVEPDIVKSYVFPRRHARGMISPSIDNSYSRRSNGDRTCALIRLRIGRVICLCQAPYAADRVRDLAFEAAIGKDRQTSRSSATQWYNWRQQGGAFVMTQSAEDEGKHPANLFPVVLSRLLPLPCRAVVAVSGWRVALAARPN